jgi:hypothetical protein
MAKIDWSKFPVIPGLDAVQAKWDIQAEIYEETKHMTPEQRREHTRKASEEFQEEIKRRRAELAALSSG